MENLRDEVYKIKKLMGLNESHNKTKDNIVPYIKNIDKDTTSNTNYRKVVFTGEKLQLVLMSIPIGEEIGFEKHDGDQFFRVEDGNCELTIDGKKHKIGVDFGFTIPSGSKHNIKNTGDKILKLYTIYSPPQHESGLIEKTKENK